MAAHPSEDGTPALSLAHVLKAREQFLVASDVRWLAAFSIAEALALREVAEAAELVDGATTRGADNELAAYRVVVARCATEGLLLDTDVVGKVGEIAGLDRPRVVRAQQD